MKSALFLVFAALSTLAVALHVTVPERRQNPTCDPNGWVQKPSGCATFTSATNCKVPSCGVNFTSGFTAAVNELAFGSNHSYGDACGRCFQVTGLGDPFNSSDTGPFGNTIIVKINNLCVNTNSSEHNWCGQTVRHPLNEFNASMHFDMCELSGASQAFFPPNLRAVYGTYQEVPCTLWQGSQGTPIWNGSCMAPDNAAFWPAQSCGNEGSAPC